MIVKKGQRVSVDYEGKFDDGEIFDSSKHGDHSHPLTFEVGSGQVIKGFDDAVLGMKIGEEKQFKISPKEAYGEHNPSLKKSLPKNLLPKNQEPKAGMTIVLNAPTGQQIPAKITHVSKDSITIDLNHPLAGKSLNFKIKLLDIHKIGKEEE